MGPSPQLHLVQTEDMPANERDGARFTNGQVDSDDLNRLTNPPSPDEQELHQAFEVVFNNSGFSRRKASMISSDYEQAKEHIKATMSEQSKERPAGPRRGNTGCMVHAHLEDPHSDQQVTKNIAGQLAQQHVDKVPEAGQDENQQASRLLTKKQLSDMALGIRELSKKLSHVQLKLKVRNVFILSKVGDPEVSKKTRELTEWILQNGAGMDQPYNVYVEETMKEDKEFDAASLIKQDSKYEDRIRYWTTELCKEKPQTFDIVLAMGGDGTVLYSSWLFQKIVPPVLSFALGSLGFLTKFDFNNHAKTLTDAFNDGITVSLRLRFEGTVMKHYKDHDNENKDQPRDLVEELIGEESDDHYTHKPQATHNILNEVVIDRGPNATMSTLEVFGDNEHYTTVQADGICIATPTGSTAYNLAAGGSLCHPDNPVILLTAICAHTLSFRPLVLPDTMVLRIGVPYDARASAWASFDGKERVELCPGDYVTISASRFPFPSVLPCVRKKEDWIDSISRTLNWNSRERQKAWKGTETKKEG